MHLHGFQAMMSKNGCLIITRWILCFQEYAALACSLDQGWVLCMVVYVCTAFINLYQIQR